MTRVKRGVISAKRRRNVLADAKGYRHQRSTTERAAKVAIIKAGVYAFTHRKDKKNDMRRLWTIRMNAALRPLGVTYITLDRKVLSEIARTNPTAFAQIVEQVK